MGNAALAFDAVAPDESELGQIDEWTPGSSESSLFG
jgi:hypothetical protein